MFSIRLPHSRAVFRRLGSQDIATRGFIASSFPAPSHRQQRRTMAQQAGHSVPSPSVVAAEPLDAEIKAFQEHQAAAPRPSLAEDAKTLVANAKFGVLSTFGTVENEIFPAGSVVEYAVDAQGLPIFSFSSLSPHTGDVRSDSRCSLTVMADGFRGLGDARANVIGKMTLLSDAAEIAAAKRIYLAQNPQSFWVEFGDFAWFKMEQVLSARLVGGFARAGRVSGEEYLAAAVDPVAQFSGPVCRHMNADHADSTRAMVKHYAGITVEKASMLSLDRLGVNVACERRGEGGPDAQVETFKVRLPYPRPAEDRKAIKELIVEMTRAAAAVQQEAGENQ